MRITLLALALAAIPCITWAQGQSKTEITAGEQACQMVLQQELNGHVSNIAMAIRIQTEANALQTKYEDLAKELARLTDERNALKEQNTQLLAIAPRPLPMPSPPLPPKIPGLLSPPPPPNDPPPE